MTEKLTIHNFNTQCPHCGKWNNLHSLPGEEVVSRPTEGDVSFCFGCGQFSMYDKRIAGQLRLPTDAESVEIYLDAGAQRVMKAWNEMQE